MTANSADAQSLIGWLEYGPEGDGLTRNAPGDAGPVVCTDWLLGGNDAIAGSLAATLANVTLSAAGSVALSGALGATLSGLTVSAQGALAITAATARVLADVMLSSAAVLEIKGQEGGTLAPLTLSAAAKLANAGQLAATLGDATLAAVGAGDTPAVVSFRRGDDAGARERFWRRKAEEWLQDKLEALEGAVGRPQRARKRLATRIIADVPDFVSEIPDLAPRVNAIETLAQRLLQPAPDYSAIAEAVAAQMALIEAWKTMERRRRDIEALLVLAA